MTTAAPTTSLTDVLERAEALLPRLRERARSAEELRRLPDETVQDFHAAGLFRVLQPARYGGYQLDYGRTQVELCSVLGQACGSSAWIQCVIACHAWCLGMFAPEAQDAVWGADPDTLVASSFAPKTGRGHPVEGGYYVAGDWQFSSGSNICQWVILGTPIFESAGAPPARMLWTLLPHVPHAASTPRGSSFKHPHPTTRRPTHAFSSRWQRTSGVFSPIPPGRRRWHLRRR